MNKNKKMLSKSPYFKGGFRISHFYLGLPCFCWSNKCNNSDISKARLGSSFDGRVTFTPNGLKILLGRKENYKKEN